MMQEDELELNKVKDNCEFDKQCHLEVVKYSYTGGGSHFIKQCTVCGKLNHKMIAKQKIHDPNSVRSFDQKKLEDYEIKIAKLKEQGLKSWEFFKSTLQLHQENREQIYVQHFGEPYIDFQTTYATYINSDLWKERRMRILKRDNGKCRICKTKDANQVHHISYRNLCDESDLELISVCLECHDTIHHRMRAGDYY